MNLHNVYIYKTTYRGDTLLSHSFSWQQNWPLKFLSSTLNMVNTRSAYLHLTVLELQRANHLISFIGKDLRFTDEIP